MSVEVVGSGRKLKLVEAFGLLVDAVRRGLPTRVAADLVGVSRTAISRWLKYGQQEQEWSETHLGGTAAALPERYEDGVRRDPIYREFYAAMVQARAARQLECVGRIFEAAQDPKNWNAAAFLLERSDPEHWGRREKLSVGHHVGSSEPSAEITDELKERMARAILDQLAITRRLPSISQGSSPGEGQKETGG